MNTLEYKPSPLDPAFAQLMQDSQSQDIEAIQGKLQGDSASLLARFGARQAYAGTTGIDSAMVGVSGATSARSRATGTAY